MAIDQGFKFGDYGALLLELRLEGLSSLGVPTKALDYALARIEFRSNGFELRDGVDARHRRRGQNLEFRRELGRMLLRVLLLGLETRNLLILEPAVAFEPTDALRILPERTD